MYTYYLLTNLLLLFLRVRCSLTNCYVNIIRLISRRMFYHSSQESALAAAAAAVDRK